NDNAAELQQIGLVPAGAVQQQQCPLGRLTSARLKLVNKTEVGRHDSNVPSGRRIGVSKLSSDPRSCSYHGGSFNSVPNRSSGSSTANPGVSVAISSSTLPGSRK